MALWLIAALRIRSKFFPRTGQSRDGQEKSDMTRVFSYSRI
jgi:hypothetical protein